MSVVIPFRNDLPAFKETVQLDTIVYQLRFKWNTRAQQWIMSILTATGEPIVEGQRICKSVGIFNKYTDTRLPRGGLVLVDLQNRAGEPGRDDLGDRFILVYLTEEEVGAII